MAGGVIIAYVLYNDYTKSIVNDYIKSDTAFLVILHNDFFVYNIV